jgi:hypothetical protein
LDLPSEKLEPLEKLAGKIDTRSLDELMSEPTYATGQLLLRACCGDEQAIFFFAMRVSEHVYYLETLSKYQPDKVRSLASTYDRWPVLLSLNPQDIQIAMDQIKSLNVGAAAAMPTRTGQKVDRRIYWTRLVQWAIGECMTCGMYVKILERLAAKRKASAKTVETKIWNKSVHATCWYLRDGNTYNALVITEWEKHCASLAVPITDRNFNEWWSVVQEFTREALYSSEELYSAALREIGQTNRPKYERRSMALDRVRQTLKSMRVKVP